MRSFLCLAAVVAACTVALGQAALNAKTEAVLLRKVIVQNHFAPRLVDDTFSAIVFDNFVKALDPDRLLFTQADLAALARYRDKIDLDLQTDSWVTLPAFTQAYKKALERSIVMSGKYATTPFEFKTKEAYTSDTTWAADEAASQERWRITIKYGTLRRLAELRSRYATERDDDFVKKHEAEARQQVIARYASRSKRILQHPDGFANYVSTTFLHSIASTFDAHTRYFSPKEWQNFLSALGTKGVYFGLTFKENDMSEIEIDQLTPGGPAWKSGVVYTGDVVERLKWEGHEWIDLYGMDADEVSDILDESNTLPMTFELRNKSGERKTVMLRKEKISSEENVVRSFVLDGPHKIGYIFLPGFYTSWGDAGSSRCANDVAKEIIKLKDQKIEGLILDVRFNGGGSLEEAVAMAGIFIDAGPIGVTKDKAGQVVSQKDMNRGTIYDGPLVLMVNAMSASASEFLAAALQDYRRAIVVGGQTFGKATAQHLFALDPKATPGSIANVKSTNGFATVTTQKIYRITGKTAQRRGVVPNMMLPDLLDSLRFREQDTPLTLAADSVQKKTYYQPLNLLPLDELKAKSEARVAASPAFGAQAQYGHMIAQSLRYKTVPLAWTHYMALREERGKDIQRLQALFEQPSSAYTLRSHDDRQRINDEFARDIQASWMKKLQRDIYLEESFRILCDYITEP